MLSYPIGCAAEPIGSVILFDLHCKLEPMCVKGYDVRGSDTIAPGIYIPELFIVTISRKQLTRVPTQRQG